MSIYAKADVGGALDPLRTNCFITTWCHSNSSRIAEEDALRRLVHSPGDSEDPSTQPTTTFVNVGAESYHKPEFANAPQTSYYSGENSFTYTTLAPIWMDVEATMRSLHCTKKRRHAARELAIQAAQREREEASRRRKEEEVS